MTGIGAILAEKNIVLTGADAFTEKGFTQVPNARLADDIGVSRQTANEYLQELKRKGFVNIVRKGQGRPNLYELRVSRH